MAEGDYVYSYTYTDNTSWRFIDSCEAWRTPEPPPEVKIIEKESPKKIEGVETMILYDVYLVYAEDRKSPIVINKFGVIARNEEDAKIKSGLMKEVQDNWDADYLNFIVKEIGDVRVKEKPKEVKQVK